MMKWQALPPILFYPLLIPHVVKLCIKYRTTLPFIALSNPGFPYGGLPFASKFEIMNVFKDAMDLPYVLIVPEWDMAKKQQVVRDFLAQTSFPIIAKPDTGHRGLDVKKIGSKEELDELLKTQRWNYILQAFSPYPEEFGVFYYRYPSKVTGDVFSITRKVIPTVVGDGQTSLEGLIQASDFPKKEHYLANLNSVDRVRVPASGDRVNVMVTASHCLGTDFSDATSLKTPQLVEKLNQICENKGFYFGRLDVKAENIEAFQQGRFQILEVNGCTSEFGHSYDDKYNFKEGINLYKHQWNLLFSISNENRGKARQLGFFELMGKYLSFFLESKRVTGKYW